MKQNLYLLTLGKYSSQVYSNRSDFKKGEFIRDIIEEIHEEEMTKYWHKSSEWRMNRLDKIEQQLEREEFNVTKLK